MCRFDDVLRRSVGRGSGNDAEGEEEGEAGVVSGTGRSRADDVGDGEEGETGDPGGCVTPSASHSRSLRCAHPSRTSSSALAASPLPLLRRSPPPGRDADGGCSAGSSNACSAGLTSVGGWRSSWVSRSAWLKTQAGRARSRRKAVRSGEGRLGVRGFAGGGASGGTLLVVATASSAGARSAAMPVSAEGSARQDEKREAREGEGKGGKQRESRASCGRT